MFQWNATYLRVTSSLLHIICLELRLEQAHPYVLQLCCGLCMPAMQRHIMEKGQTDSIDNIITYFRIN